MKINQSANKEYYQSQQSIPCDCKPCQNYRHKIKDHYPKLCQFLAEWAIDVGRPFEIDWIEAEDSSGVQYLLVQYLCFGECSDDYHQVIEGLRLTKARYYPPVSVEGNFFVMNVEGVGIQ